MKSGNEGAARQRYYALDGLRGLAAILVVFFHFGASGQQHVPGGYLAVDFFFVLSGFVIARSYSHKLADGMSFWRFALTRFVRLWPTYIAGIALGLFAILGLRMLALSDGNILAALISVPFSIAMLPTPGRTQLFPLDVPAWSLFLETIANGIFALILFKLRSHWIVVLLAALAVVLLASIDSPRWMDVGARWSDVHLGLVRAVYSFTLGVLIQRHWTISKRQTWLVLIPAALLIAMVLVPDTAALQPGRDIVAAFLICPLLVVMGMRWEVPSSLTWLCAFLGDLSYPLYIVHRPLLRTIIIVSEELHLPDAAGTMLFLGVAAAVAIAVERWFAKPLQEWLSRKLGLRVSAPPQVV